MATIHREFEIEASPEEAWARLRDVGGINRYITFLGEVTVEGDRRSCSLGDGGTLEELIITVDDDQRRVAYSIIDSPFGFEHHSASMQIGPGSNGGSRFAWTSDVKPDATAPVLAEAVDAAVESFKQTMR